MFITCKQYHQFFGDGDGDGINFFFSFVRREIMFFAIPSYGRPVEIHKKTLAFLKANNIPYPLITIFVASEEEKLDYEINNPEYTIVVGVKGIMNQRNFIFNYYPLNAEVVSIDDDIDALYRLKEDYKLEEVSNFIDIAKNAFTSCKENGRNLWGIYPIKNSYYMKDIITTDFRFIIGHLFGFINKKILLTQPLKEDYELSALYSEQDGGVIRINNICAKTTMYAKGGVGSKDSRKETNMKCVYYLIDKYPQYYAQNRKKEGELRCLY